MQKIPPVWRRSGMEARWLNGRDGQAVLGEAILENPQVTKAEAALVAVEMLVAEHSLMAFRIAYSILRNHHDAEDAVQECFLRILKHAKRLNQVRKPKTWVARVAWTAALDRRSSRARVSAHEDPGQSDFLTQVQNPCSSADEQL